MKSKLIALTLLSLVAIILSGCSSSKETVTTTTTREQGSMYAR